MSSEIFSMIMFKCFLFSFTNFCVIVFSTNLPASTAWISSTFLDNLSSTSFLTTFFFTRSLRLLKSTGIVFKLPTSNLSISDFKLAKSTFLANFYVNLGLGKYQLLKNLLTPFYWRFIFEDLFFTILLCKTIQKYLHR